MSSSFKQFICEHKQKPSVSLLSRITRQINMEIEKRALTIVRYYKLLNVLSLFAVVGTCFYFARQFVTSEFCQYVTLFFSDSTAFAYWKEFGLSLIESLPVIAIATSLLFIGLWLWSLSKIAEKSRVYLQTKHIISI